MGQQVQLKIVEKSATARRFSLGIVYEPGSVDTQGDFAKADDIEAAAWEFMSRLQRLAKSASAILACALTADATGVTLDVTDVSEDIRKGAGLDDEHLQIGDDEDLGTIVESYIAPDDMIVNGQPVKKGSWLLGVVWSEAMFEKIKNGERVGLSLYGRADQIDEAVSA